MTAYCIAFGRNSVRRYMAVNVTEGERAKGWRAFIWTKDVERAEKYGSIESAHRLASEALGHDRFEVVIAPSRGIPTDDLGGTPGAIMLAKVA